MTTPYRYARPLTSEPSLDPPDPPREPEEPQPRAMKPTPGPWTYAARTTRRGWTSEFSINGPDWRNMAIVYVQDDDRHGDEPILGSGEANARLMAAAPDLLAACERLYRHAIALWMGANPTLALAEIENDEVIKAAYAAIAKAKGGDA